MLEKRFNNIPKYFKKTPMDGGRWDSNQHQYRLSVVMEKMLNMYIDVSEPHLASFLDFNKADIDMHEYSKSVKDVGYKHDTFLFSKIEGVNGPEWTE
jgi:hypothetical protein